MRAASRALGFPGCVLLALACDVWSYRSNDAPDLATETPLIMTAGADGDATPGPPDAASPAPEAGRASGGASTLPPPRRCSDSTDAGFDLQRDPNNCGACGNVCTLSNADAFCAQGACQIARCLPGFLDADGVPDNGCERAECVRTFVPIGDTERIVSEPAPELCAEGAGICRIENGELVFGFCMSSCTESWDGCRLNGADLAEFDRPPIGTEDRLLQIDFCVDYGTISFPLNLWYGGDAAQKKWIPLVEPGQPLVAGQCYQRIFDRRQAKIADDPTIACGCVPDSDAAACQLSRTDNLRVIAEWCTGSHSGQVRITSIQTLTGSCSCSSDSAPTCVEEDAQCRPLDWSECPVAGSGCSNDSCGGSPRPGATCNVDIDGDYCTGHIVCDRGQKGCVCDE